MLQETFTCCGETFTCARCNIRLFFAYAHATPAASRRRLLPVRRSPTPQTGDARYPDACDRCEVREGPAGCHTSTVRSFREARSVTNTTVAELKPWNIPASERTTDWGRPHGSVPHVDNGAVLDGFHGRVPAEGTNQERKFEQPWHKTLAYTIASGKYTVKQAAAVCDCSPVTVSALLRNKWFAETVAAIQKEVAMEGDLMDIFRAEVPASMLKLIEVRDAAKSRPADIISASREILDRLRGKPQQTIRTESVQTSDDPVAEAERLERLNASLTKSASTKCDLVDDDAAAARISFDDTLPPS